MGILDLNDLKEQIQTILQESNTITASTDLSGGLTTKIAKVLKLNPLRIPIQASYYPYVTTFIDRNDIELPVINQNQLKTLRKSTVNVNVIGAVWNSTIDDTEVDPADEECELLMENIEKVLRDSSKLNGVVDWHMPIGVTYHNGELEDGVHIRAGILTMQCTKHYSIEVTRIPPPPTPPTWAKSKYIDFNGTDEQIETDVISTSILSNSEDFSVSVWVKWIGTQPAGPTIITNGQGNTVGGFSIYGQNSSRYYIAIRTNNYTKHSMLVNPFNNYLNDGNWHHLVVTWADGGGAFALMHYFDGVDAESIVVRSSEPNMNVVHPPWPICVGCQPYSPTDRRYWLSGHIAETTIWKNKVLSLAEVVALYNSGNGLDPTVNAGDYGSAAECVLSWGMGDVSGDTTEAVSGIQSFAGSKTGTAVNMTDVDNIKTI